MRLIIDINGRIPEWEVLGYVDKNPKLKGGRIDGLKVYRPQDLPESKRYYGICGIMDPWLRRKIVSDEIEAKRYKLPVLIHPDTARSGDFEAGEGSIVFSGVHISFDVKIGKCVIVSLNTDLGHELRVGNYTSIMPSSTIGGNCRIGRNCIVGAGATFHQGLKIGNDSIIGIGTTIVRDVPGRTSVADFPRKIIRGRV